MMYPGLRKTLSIILFVCLVGNSMAQDPGSKAKLPETIAQSKPFRILTNGRRITIQSNQDINRILAWTTSGRRIVEQNSFASASYSFTVPNTEKVFFLMVQLKNGKYYTEKVGVQ